MKNKILIFYFSFLSLGSIQAEVVTKTFSRDSLQIQIDTVSLVQPLIFDKIKLSQFKNSDDFEYTEMQIEDTWWTQIKHWFKEWWHQFLNAAFDIGEVSGIWLLVLEVLPYLLLVCVLGLIVWLFIRGKAGRILNEKEELTHMLFEDDQEIIKNQNIIQLIEQAVTEGKYRLAIRYHYLMVIKLLADSDSIALAAQKTNSDYLLEIKSQSLKNDFKELTQFYNFIWYGHFDVDTLNYAQFETKFLQFRNLITSTSS